MWISFLNCFSLVAVILLRVGTYAFETTVVNSKSSGCLLLVALFYNVFYMDLLNKVVLFNTQIPSGVCIWYSLVLAYLTGCFLIGIFYSLI